jgi:uncharacterized membrane protein
MSNVTPFRRPKRPPLKLNVQSPRGKAVLVEAMALLTFVLSFVFPAPPLSFLAIVPAIVGVLVASQNREAAMPWARTHHEFGLRTIVIGMVALMLISLVGLLPLIHALYKATVMFWGMVIVCLWGGLRGLIGLVMAIMRRAIPHPRGLLI